MSFTRHWLILSSFISRTVIGLAESDLWYRIWRQSLPCADRSAQNRDRHQCAVACRAPKQKHEATGHSFHSTPETTKSKLFPLHEHRFSFMLKVYVPLAQDEELDMSEHVSLCSEPHAKRAYKSSSLRSLICTASRARLDQILSSFVKEGIATPNFDEITGMRQVRQSGSSNGFEDALMNSFDNVDKGKETYEAMSRSRTIRAPYNHVDSLYEDVESDIRVLRLGRTDNYVASSLDLMKGRLPGMEDEESFTEAHGTVFLAVSASALASIREADVIFTACAMLRCRNTLEYYLREARNFALIAIILHVSFFG
jgi:hypothetical protein